MPAQTCNISDLTGNSQASAQTPCGGFCDLQPHGSYQSSLKLFRDPAAPRRQWKAAGFAYQPHGNTTTSKASKMYHMVHRAQFRLRTEPIPINIRESLFEQHSGHTEGGLTNLCTGKYPISTCKILFLFQAQEGM